MLCPQKLGRCRDQAGVGLIENPVIVGDLEAIAINDFVLHGKDDPAVALHGQGFWTWDTEEVFEMIKWMRAYNVDPEHAKKILFYGFDMQAFDSAAKVALDALATFEPSKVHKLRSRFKPLMSRNLWTSLRNVVERNWADLSDAVNDLVWDVEAHRDELVTKVRLEGYNTIHRHAVVARQCFEMLRGFYTQPHSNRNWRDIAMAANVKWIADRHPGQRIIAWAHNGHISKFGPSMGGQTMGSELDQLFGKEYVNFGFSFCQGTLQAVNQPLSGAPPDWRFDLRTHRAAMAPRGSVGRTFAHTGIPIFAIDLRGAPDGGDIRTWFESPQPMRSVGSVYNERMADSYFPPTALLDHFDCMFFVESTTCAVAMPPP
ncbi:MAG: erythromycin esterase family protein [Planctomycetes bacterium]|nr:erythromycin esterase family protein [Planctomycetota bacterium]